MNWKDTFLQKNGPGLLPGVTFRTWISLLRQVDFDLDREFIPRATFVTGTSFLNSIAKRIEWIIHQRKIARQEVTAPVFILGSWRSGTTYLQNLLSNDKGFGTPNLYQTLFPGHFLYTEPLLAKLIGKLIPGNRPQDNVELSSEQPSEEEIAISTLCGMSHLVGDVMFPRNRGQFTKFIDLRGLSSKEQDQWRSAYVYFLKKLAIRHQKPLMLKSPANTARIKTILELFPDAKFIHIHRHPYDVVRSGISWLKRVRMYWGFQRSDDADVNEIFLTNYRNLLQTYFDQRRMISESRLVEIAFQELESEPLTQLKHIYQHLGLPGFEKAKTAFASYIAANSSYQKNDFSPPPDDLKIEIWEAGQLAFDAWGYPRFLTRL